MSNVLWGCSNQACPKALQQRRRSNPDDKQPSLLLPDPPIVGPTEPDSELPPLGRPPDLRSISLTELDTAHNALGNRIISQTARH